MLIYSSHGSALIVSFSFFPPFLPYLLPIFSLPHFFPPLFPYVLAPQASSFLTLFLSSTPLFVLSSSISSLPPHPLVISLPHPLFFPLFSLLPPLSLFPICPSHFIYPPYHSLEQPLFTFSEAGSSVTCDTATESLGAECWWLDWVSREWLSHWKSGWYASCLRLLMLERNGSCTLFRETDTVDKSIASTQEGCCTRKSGKSMLPLLFSTSF